MPGRRHDYRLRTCFPLPWRVGETFFRALAGLGSYRDRRTILLFRSIGICPCIQFRAQNFQFRSLCCQFGCVRVQLFLLLLKALAALLEQRLLTEQLLAMRVHFDGTSAGRLHLVCQISRAE